MRNNEQFVASRDVIQVLETILNADEEELTLDSYTITAIQKAIKAVKAVDMVRSEIKQLYRDFSNQRGSYVDGLRKGLQCIEETINENM
jgi:hypothetical protein